VSAARRKLIVAASALGLGLSVATQATGAPAHPAAKQRPVAKRSGIPRADYAELPVLDKPGDRFIRSLEAARRRIRRARAAESAQSTQGIAGSHPTPEAVGVASATLSAIASCESGGDPSAVSADGAYRGKYQFDDGTWASIGGSGDPAAAPESEQDYRAALLYARVGASPWPSCG
jgi:soluble lytic murein transglycosylase-like protein